MELNNIPEAFQTKLRIAILSSLISGKKTFKEIKKLTGATDGNISIQVSKLEEYGYLVSVKEFQNRKPCTTYELTEMGRNGFIEYVDMLERLIKG
jgi:DNA-binding HxlR family transcriptional regulator